MRKEHEALKDVRPTLWHFVVIAVWVVDTIVDGRSSQVDHEKRRDSLVKRLDTPGAL
jgi:hypothetical protein